MRTATMEFDLRSRFQKRSQAIGPRGALQLGDRFGFGLKSLDHDALGFFVDSIYNVGPNHLQGDLSACLFLESSKNNSHSTTTKHFKQHVVAKPLFRLQLR